MSYLKIQVFKRSQKSSDSYDRPSMESLSSLIELLLDQENRLLKFLEGKQKLKDFKVILHRSYLKKNK